MKLVVLKIDRAICQDRNIRPLDTKIVPVVNPEQTKYVWFAEVDTDNTVIYANFQGADPNEEFVEINVRRSCFYPTKTGRDYITIRGFEWHMQQHHGHLQQLINLD